MTPEASNEASHSARLAIVIPNLSGGGAEFVAVEWAKWLARVRYEVLLITTHPKPGQEGPRGVQTVLLAGTNALSRVLELRRLLAHHRVDAAIALMPYCNLVLLLATMRLPHRRTAVIISGRNVETPFRNTSTPGVRLMKSLARLTYRSADAYLAISHPVAAEAVALYRIPSAKVFVVPNPALAKTTFEKVVPRSKPLKATGDTNHTRALNIVVPARLVAQKRPELAILVAGLLRGEFDKVTVHFFGDGQLRDSTARFATRHDVDAVFHGWVADWFNACPRNSVVLLPSVAEGFANVLLEAAAVGVPCVVSSRALGAADAIIPGVSGYLCAGDSAGDFAEAVRRASSLNVRVPEGWLRRFTTASSGAAVEQVIATVLNTGLPLLHPACQ